MGRGQLYEVPHARPRPVYGPIRPPVSSSTATATPERRLDPISQPRNTGSRSTSTQIRPIFILLIGTETDTTMIDNLRAKSRHGPVFEVIVNIDEAEACFSRHPSAVFVHEKALREPALECVKVEAARYVQGGGCLVTDLDHLPVALAQCDATQRSLVHDASLYSVSKNFDRSMFNIRSATLKQPAASSAALYEPVHD